MTLPTVRIKRLLATRINTVRVDFVGEDAQGLARLGAVLLYGPFVAIGYLFLVGGLARLVAMRVGWGWSCFILGGAHVLFGLYGLTTRQRQTSEDSYPLGELEIENGEEASDRLDTLITGQATPPAFPPRTRSSP